MKTIGIIAIGVGLAMASAGATWFAVAWLPVHQVESKVRIALKDPDSAKFMNVTYNPKTSAGCGFVNAKNSMGGYIGMTHFVATSEGAVHFSPNEHDSEVGTTEERVKALEAQIADETLSLKNCLGAK
jgi:hypothetical protein